MEDSILNSIRIEHQIINEALKLASLSDPNLRRELYVIARNEIVKHMQAEEKSIYSRIQEEIRDVRAEHLIEKMEHQHQQIREYLQKLNLIDPASNKWKELFEKLVDVVQYHCGLEERELFEEAKEDYSKEELVEMMSDYEEAHHFNPGSLPTSF